MFDSTVQPDELSEYRGIFDFDNPENPFRNFGVVFVPYCAALVLRRLWNGEADLEAEDLTLERAHAEVAAARPDAVWLRSPATGTPCNPRST